MRVRKPAIQFAEPWKPACNTTPNRDVTALRDEYEMSQELFGKALGLGRSHIALIETGRRKLPMSLDEARQRLDDYTVGREEDRKRIALAIAAVKARGAA